MKKIEEIESQIKDLLKEVESLKKQEPNFEVGKWYKSGKTLFNYQLDYGVYGFDDEGEWETCDSWIWETWFDGTRLATPQEVETALIAEAKRRGFKEGVMVNRTDEILTLFGSCRGDNKVVLCNNKFYYHKEEDSLTVDGRVIYIKGQWAEIIKEDKIMIGGYEVKICQTQDPQYNGSGKCSYIPTVKYTSIDGNTFSKTFWESAKYVSEHNKAKIMVGCSKQFDVSLETINKILSKL
jgi:hypothetical protein